METDFYEMVGRNEGDPLYQGIAESNYSRYFSYLQTMIEAAIQLGNDRPWLSHHLIKSINAHAIGGIHKEAGQYRDVPVSVGDYQAPPHDRVLSMMNAFVDLSNDRWNTTNALASATFTLWQINHIHPFVNGNGRTARALCYFVLCVKAGGILPGNTNLIELLRIHRSDCIDALKEADKLNFTPLYQLIRELVREQVQS